MSPGCQLSFHCGPDLWLFFGSFPFLHFAEISQFLIDISIWRFSDARSNTEKPAPNIVSLVGKTPTQIIFNEDDLVENLFHIKQTYKIIDLFDDGDILRVFSQGKRQSFLIRNLEDGWAKGTFSPYQSQQHQLSLFFSACKGQAISLFALNGKFPLIKTNFRSVQIAQ